MNVQEVIAIGRERKNRNKETIKKICDNIHKKIKRYALNNKESCSYIVPPLINDTPLYDFENIIRSIFKYLDSEGYIVTAYPNGQLDICWNETLVQQKVKTDAFVLTSEEQKLKNITKKNKKVDERFNFLVNPKKVNSIKSFDAELDDRVDKILKEKKKLMNKYSNIVNGY